jgi:hypothetical protein
MAEREGLPESDFLDPALKVGVILDEEDVTRAAAILGKFRDPAAARARLVVIAARKGLRLPQGMAPAAFAAKYTQAQLDKLLPADFADMLNRKWPVLDQEDLDACIRDCPQAREASHPIRSQLVKLAMRRQLKLPADWETAVHAADFNRPRAHAANFINTLADREAADAQAGAHAAAFARACNRRRERPATP